MSRIQKALTDHVVVAGFGTSGSEAVRELIARGIKAESIVVIDGSDDSLAIAEEIGCAPQTLNERVKKAEVDSRRRPA